MLECKTIDSLKGIAILAIILVHSGIVTSIGLVNCFINNGSRGVQIMFVINGYLIFKSLDNAKEKKITLRQWYWGKFLRIIPLYWFFTILHLLVFGMGERFYLGPLKRVSWVNILCNLLCIHGFFPYYINSINVNWFIADLIVWYLVAPFIYRWFNSLEKMVAGLLFIIPIDYVLLIVLERVPLITNEVIWKDYLSVLCFLSEFPIILLGSSIYLLVKEKNILIFPAKYRTSYGCFFFAIMGSLILVIGSDKFFVFSKLLSWGICFALLLVSQLIRPFRIINNSLFAVFGKYSYGIYLSHIFVIRGVEAITKKMKVTSDMDQIVIYLFMCFFALLISICVEKVYGWIRGLIRVNLLSENKKQ